MLPTEAQFEWACRAGTDTEHSAPKLSSIANTKDVAKGARSADRTINCREGAANPFGLFDMHGNVAEWCRDFYDPDFYRNAPDPDTDPFQGRAAFKDRVVRGGSWMSTARECRSAARRATNPESKSDEIGFRVCVTIAP